MEALLAEETYTVVIERGSLESEKRSENVQYSVALSGAVDEQWSRAFHIAQLDSTDFFLYRLEPTYRIVTFQVSLDASPGRVARLLERLERLIEDVNQSALLWGRRSSEDATTRTEETRP